jgi:hypothetical protein
LRATASILLRTCRPYYTWYNGNIYQQIFIIKF